MQQEQARALFEKSTIRGYKLDCLIRYGPAKCSRILDASLAHLSRLAQEEEEPPVSPAGRLLYGHLLPALAYYLALRENGVTEEEAVETVDAEMQRFARQEAASLHTLLRLPFRFTVFRAMARRRIPRAYPPEAFGTQRQSAPGAALVFTVHRCLYRDILHAHGADALCPAFCRAEQTAYNGLLPKIGFDRPTTLLEGDACLFRFYKRYGAQAREEPPTAPF